MTNPATFQLLRNFPDQLEALYAEVPPDRRHWAPASWVGVPSEALTAIEQVCHVRDIEVEGYQLRLRRTLAETHPHLASLDTDALAAARAYGQADAAAVLADFRAARSQTLQILSEVSEAQWQRSAFFEGYGPVSLRGLVHFLCSHDQQHLAGLQWLLGKMQTGAA